MNTDAKKREFIRVIEFDNETRLNRCQSALEALSLLCLDSRDGLPTIAGVGYLLQGICLDLEQVRIGVYDNEVGS